MINLEIEIGNKTLLVWKPRSKIKQIINPSTGIVEQEFAKEYFDSIDCYVFDKNNRIVDSIENYKPTADELKIINDTIYDTNQSSPARK